MEINPIGSYCLHPAKNEMSPHSQGNSRSTTANNSNTNGRRGCMFPKILDFPYMDRCPPGSLRR